MQEFPGLFRTPKLVLRPLTQDILKEYVTYDEHSGEMTLIKSNSPALRNKLPMVFGTTNADGYLYGMIERKTYSVHRLIWLYMTGSFPSGNIRVDHEDRCKVNNRWCNLRLLSHGENVRNQSPTKKATKSGLTGVFYDKSRNKPWVAHIRVDKKLQFLGAFASMEEAASARRNALENLTKETKL